MFAAIGCIVQLKARVGGEEPLGIRQCAKIDASRVQAYVALPVHCPLASADVLIEPGLRFGQQQCLRTDPVIAEYHPNGECSIVERMACWRAANHVALIHVQHESGQAVCSAFVLVLKAALTESQESTVITDLFGLPLEESLAARLSALNGIELSIDQFERALEAYQSAGENQTRRAALSKFCHDENLHPPLIAAEAIMTRLDTWLEATGSAGVTKESHPDVYEFIVTGPISVNRIAETVD